MMQDQRLLVFLCAPDDVAPLAPPRRYQWRRNQVDLPGANQRCVLLESSTHAHPHSVYTVLIEGGIGGSGGERVLRPPAVLATLCTTSNPPWRWPELAAELRGQPDLFATLFTVFRELCGRALQPAALGATSDALQRSAHSSC